jgi:hypothetical protein
MERDRNPFARIRPLVEQEFDDTLEELARVIQELVALIETDEDDEE